MRIILTILMLIGIAQAQDTVKVTMTRPSKDSTFKSVSLSEADAMRINVDSLLNIYYRVYIFSKYGIKIRQKP